MSAFARDALGMPLRPWQEEAAVRAMELMPDGRRYRWSKIVILAGRQSGKSHLLRAIICWRLFCRQGEVIVGSAQTTNVARLLWEATVALVRSVPELSERVVQERRANGDEVLRTGTGGEYRLTARNRSAGRGMTATLLVLDELAEARDWDEYSALSPITAVAEEAGQGQTIGISSGPDDDSVVLLGLLESAGERTAVIEWSAEPGADPDDLGVRAQANPGWGYGGTGAAVLDEARANLPVDKFRREFLAQRVASDDRVIRPEQWVDCCDVHSRLDARHVALCFDGAPDHATLVAATPTRDGRIRVEVVCAWGDLDEARRDLAGWIKLVRPGSFGWYPSGPAAALATELAKLSRRGREISAGAVPVACLGLVEAIRSRRLIHNGCPLLTCQVVAARRQSVGDRWRFQRGGEVHSDAVFALAGAVHLGKTARKRERRTIIVPTDIDEEGAA